MDKKFKQIYYSDGGSNLQIYKFKQIYYSDEVKVRSRDWQKYRVQRKRSGEVVTETALVSDLPSCPKVCS